MPLENEMFWKVCHAIILDVEAQTETGNRRKQRATSGGTRGGLLLPKPAVPLGCAGPAQVPGRWVEEAGVPAWRSPAGGGT